MFKKLIATFMVIFSSAAFAADILLIKSGSKNGSSAQRNNIYAQVLKQIGYNVNLTDSMHNELAVEMYNNAEGPALLLWSTVINGRYNVDFSDSEFMAIEYSAPMYICTIKENASKTTGIVAIQRNYPKQPVAAMGYKNFVPYRSSTDVTNAGIAGEVDFVYVNKSGNTKMQELGKICETIPVLEYVAYAIAKNVDTDEMRKVIRQVIESAEIKVWQEKRKYTTENTTFDYKKDINFVRNQIAIWQNADR